MRQFENSPRQIVVPIVEALADQAVHSELVDLGFGLYPRAPNLGSA
jgi:hypothetical protein